MTENFALSQRRRIPFQDDQSRSWLEIFITNKCNIANFLKVVCKAKASSDMNSATTSTSPALWLLLLLRKSALDSSVGWPRRLKTLYLF